MRPQLLAGEREDERPPSRRSVLHELMGELTAEAQRLMQGPVRARVRRHAAQGRRGACPPRVGRRRRAHLDAGRDPPRGATRPRGAGRVERALAPRAGTGDRTPARQRRPAADDAPDATDPACVRWIDRGERGQSINRLYVRGSRRGAGGRGSLSG
jgi:hypothetical protein